MPRKQAQELEEFQLFRVFDAAAEHAAANPQKCIAISAALQHAIFQLSPASPPEIFTSNLHMKLCRTNEILWAMEHASILLYEIGERGLIHAVARRARDVSEYFRLLSLHAKDVALTYRFDPDTLYGDLWYNSSKGPDFWK
ncbi:MAG: hypothetical protein E6R03_18065 [Hyphomicrobiaceae bacterium]|nr:MAG: hypothetical protein E6R03_18065 [Hyphomicrobiaceae bacterium]